MLDASAIESIREHEDRIASSDGGLRCLYFAVGSSLDSMSLVGLIAMSDPPRAGIDEVISKLIAGGVRVAMITGGKEQTRER